MSPAPVPLGVEDTDLENDEVVDADRPWIVLVWNDPINLMSYVSHVFQKLFGYSKAKADQQHRYAGEVLGPSDGRLCGHHRHQEARRRP